MHVWPQIIDNLYINYVHNNNKIVPNFRKCLIRRQVADWFTNWRARTWKKDILRTAHWSRVGIKVRAMIHFVKRCQEAERQRPGGASGGYIKGRVPLCLALSSPGAAVRDALDNWGG